MKKTPVCCSLVPVVLLWLTTPWLSAKEFQSLFDGKSLDGWKGVEGFWSVRDGAIVGQTTAENPTTGNTFLVWQGGDVADFEFSCLVRFEGNNSGVQYRSAPVDDQPFVLMGYQADLHPKPEYFGMMYGEKFGKRGIIATRHQRVEFARDESKKVIAELAPQAEWNGADWNTLRIVAVGNRLVHLVNDVATVEITDNHPLSMASGKLGLQLHAGPPMKVEFKDLKYRPLAGELARQVLDEAAAKFPQAVSDERETDGAAYGWIGEAPAPVWIWRAAGAGDDPLFLRRAFPLPNHVKFARLYCACDNRVTLWINGKEAGVSTDWEKPILLPNISDFLVPGINQIAARAQNQGGAAGFVLKLEIETTDGKKVSVVSDADWKLSATGPEGWQQRGFADEGWTEKLAELGSFGVKPWGMAGFERPDGHPSGKKLAAPSGLMVPKDFAVDLLYRVPNEKQGSWVSLCAEPGGGFYACDQRDRGLYHVTVKESGEVEVEQVDLTFPGSETKLTGAQGLHWAMGSLWFHQSGGGLFRISDADKDGRLDLVEEHPTGAGGGEHGNHAVLLDETGQRLYLCGGNTAPIPPEEHTARRRVQSWDEDHLLPRLWDPKGHARGRLAPGGWISKYDPETKTHDLYCMGFRNHYDMALNSCGDLFACDSDMEWDLGSYWYRPTRINFAVSGSDQGWRSGSGKWPAYFEDSLPPVVEIGPGSPTGMVFGTGAKFPAKYQRALFALDWTFGTIWAVHIEPRGAGYTGEKEAFVAGAPLPVTDAAIGKDGDLYFITGGRGTQSGFYRIRYHGGESTEAVSALDPTPERKIARGLEACHGRENKAAIEAAWPHLSSGDAFLRHAARVAIESQPVGQWAHRVLKESNPQALIAGAVALARSGDNSHQIPLLEALDAVDFGGLTEREKLGMLRAYSLIFLRLGKADEWQRFAVADKLDRHFPAESPDVNTELIRVLSYLQSPTLVEKTLELIGNRGKTEIPDWAGIVSRNAGYGRKVQEYLDNPPPSREIFFAMMIAPVHRGWALEDRRACIELLNEAAECSGGASFPGYLANIRDLHLGAMSNDDRAAITDISGENFNPVPDFEIPPVKGPGQAYTFETAAKSLDSKGASFENGRSLFFSATCGACHRLGGLGGDVGPDLTSIPHKFDAKYVLEAILDPSKDISSQYSMFEVKLADGSVKTGLLVERGDEVAIYPPDPAQEPDRVPASQVLESKQLPVSQMPAGLLNVLNPEEVRDLMAYLMSSGDRNSQVYAAGE